MDDGVVGKTPTMSAPHPLDVSERVVLVPRRQMSTTQAYRLASDKLEEQGLQALQLSARCDRARRAVGGRDLRAARRRRPRGGRPGRLTPSAERPPGHPSSLGLTG